MGIILFITALILTSISFLISIVLTPIYYLISLKWKSGIKALNSYFVTLAVSIDQFGNGATKEVLNRILIKKSSVTHERTETIEFLDFGDIDLTVSYVIGVNKYLDNLTRFGKLIERLLNLIDKGHVEKALANQFKKDQEARNRLSSPEYYDL